MAWYRLGFSADDVVGAWQDWRLAMECVEAWQRLGRPPELVVLQTGGREPYLAEWYLDDASARLLDAGGVGWRRFLVAGGLNAPPAGATPALDFSAAGLQRDPLAAYGITPPAKP